MKVSILVTLVVLPMFASIALYCYAFLSTNWIHLDNQLINQYTSTNQAQERETDATDQTIQFEHQLIRQEFRSHYGLFGYCLDSKWLNLRTIKSPLNSTFSSSPSCSKPLVLCPETNLCVKECDHILECPSHSDETKCIRDYDQLRYYWKEKKCIWHSLFSDIRGLPRWFSSYFGSSPDFSSAKLVRYYIMLIFFITAPILTFFGLLILCCINCVDRFHSIPFAFVGCFSFGSFLSGTSGLGIFLYEWIHEASYQLDHTTKYGQVEQSIVALNPWIINVERLGVAFWLILAAIGINLLTTVLSCCFCCGLQSDKSKLRIYVNNDKYAIIHTGLYDE